MGRPNMLKSKPQMVIDSFGIDREKYPVVLLGVRGYYLNKGEKGVNDRNINDDAIFVDIRLNRQSVYKSVCYSFNGNTDPSYIRQGKGTIRGKKGMFVLDPGVYYAHRIGVHRGSPKNHHNALVQWDAGENSKVSENKGKVKGHRDGGKGGKNKPYPVDFGNYSINIHRGGNNTTVSEGCQTIRKSQHNEFIQLVKAEMKSIFKDDYKTKTIPYCLVTNKEHKGILSAHESARKTAVGKKTQTTATKQVAEDAVIATKEASKVAEAAAKKAIKAADTAKKAAAEATAAAKNALKSAAAAKKVAAGLGKA